MLLHDQETPPMLLEVMMVEMVLWASTSRTLRASDAVQVQVRVLQLMQISRKLQSCRAASRPWISGV